MEEGEPKEDLRYGFLRRIAAFKEMEEDRTLRKE